MTGLLFLTARTPLPSTLFDDRNQSEIKYGETHTKHRGIDKDVDVSRGGLYRDCEEDGREA